jgi:succinylglutamate desuccinylase
MKQRKNPRVIGRFSGNENGPLLVVFGGMHGNEPAGIQAIDLICKMLEVEPITNPDFTYKGHFLGIIGNIKAYKKNKRFLNRDLNRMWTPENVHIAMTTPHKDLKNEYLEIRENLDTIREEINRVNPTKLVVLDLHTTSSYGGIFTIPSDNEESMKIALELNAPVIKGMLQGIQGTTLHYFITENMGIETIAVTFESGQHEEILSVNRAIAAITNCMRSIEAVKAEDVENRHDVILQDYSKNLPKVVELVMHHGISDEDKFMMYDGYKNFQQVVKGEIIARDKNGDIQAAQDSLILMPLYQKQGEDGFFLVKKVEGY